MVHHSLLLGLASLLSQCRIIFVDYFSAQSISPVQQLDLVSSLFGRHRNCAAWYGVRSTECSDEAATARRGPHRHGVPGLSAAGYVRKSAFLNVCFPIHMKFSLSSHDELCSSTMEVFRCLQT